MFIDLFAVGILLTVLFYVWSEYFGIGQYGDMECTYLGRLWVIIPMDGKL